MFNDYTHYTHWWCSWGVFSFLSPMINAAVGHWRKTEGCGTPTALACLFTSNFNFSVNSTF